MRDFKRDRGFFTFAQNSTTDYVRLAYGLALSLKATQKSVPYLAIGITPGTIVPPEYKWAFDEIIEIPWDDAARNSEWKLENEWKAFHMTPYRETIKLDCDMLFTESIDYWWDILDSKDFWISTTARTFRNEKVTSDFYRKTFTENNLPDVYSALMYFKTNELSQQIFEQVELIFQNWDYYTFTFMDEPRPKEVSTDVAFALAIKILDLIPECTDDRDFMSFVHMKTKLQNWDDYYIKENWNDHVNVTFTDDLVLKIGLYRQTMPVHYHVKSVLTDEMIKLYEEKLK